MSRPSAFQARARSSESQQRPQHSTPPPPPESIGKASEPRKSPQAPAPDELLITCRAYQKQANTAPQGEAVEHGDDCDECHGAKVRLATPEELERIDALVERAFRASDRSPRPTPIRGRFVREGSDG